MSSRRTLTSAITLLVLLLTRISPAQDRAAELLLLHGHIITVDANDSIAQAIAIRRGIIVKVGTDGEVLAFAGHDPGIRIIDLRGHTATPGLIDTHAHIAEGGVDELYAINLSDAASVAEIVARVKAKVEHTKPGEWLKGSGWDEGKLAEHRYVTAADLDAVAPNNPVWLMHTTGHYGVANSFALKLAHITASTPDPGTGTIDRDTHGNPTGVLKEEAAMEPVTSLIPPTTLDEMRNGILHIQQVLHSEGITAVKDPDISQLHWDAYKSLLDEGQLKERICVLWHAGSTVESARKALAEINAVPRLPATLGDDRLLSCGAKIYMDGSGGARTGWVYDPWLRNGTTPDVISTGAANVGYPQVDPAVYRQMVRLLHQNGVPVGTHAVGDRAMDGLWTLTRWLKRSNHIRACATASSTPTCRRRMRSRSWRSCRRNTMPVIRRCSPNSYGGSVTSTRATMVRNVISGWSRLRRSSPEAFSGRADQIIPSLPFLRATASGPR